MSVESVHVLRKASGSVGLETIEFQVYYRVITNHEMDGPTNVLNVFPIGRVAREYSADHDLNLDNWPDMSGSGLNDEDPPDCYVWPWPLEKCDGEDFDTAEIGYGRAYQYFNLYSTNAKIISREANDTAKQMWTVAVTFTRNTKFGPEFSPREIVPYYKYEDEPQSYAAWMGGYARITDGKQDDYGPSQPGVWESIPVAQFKDGALREEHLSKEGEIKPIFVSNTAGSPIGDTMRQRKATPAFKCSWMSYTALDFTEAIGKVNSESYILAAWDSHPHWPTNNRVAVAASDVDQVGADFPVCIFYRCFNKRELLVYAVDCSMMQWNGRNCYKYTVDLIYDRDGHDKYIMNQGFDVKSSEGDKTPSGGEVSEDESGERTNPTAQATGTDGKALRKEIPLDTDGGPLLQYTAEGEIQKGADQAIWLRYRTHEEVDFYDPYANLSGSGGEYAWGSAVIGQSGDRTKAGYLGRCPLFYDGGLRYQGLQLGANGVAGGEKWWNPQLGGFWPDGDCRPPDSGNSGDDTSSGSLHPPS